MSKRERAPLPRAADPRTWSLPDAAGMLWRPVRSLLTVVGGDEPPLELQLVGRVVLHAIVVGLTVGAAGCLLLSALDMLESLIMGKAALYPALHAAGEHHTPHHAGSPRWWLIAIAPALGALVSGLIGRWAPEVNGGGGDAMIEAFHHPDRRLRRRVVLAKPLASLATLGTGGAGGREGPTMQLGAALATWVSSVLRISERERRVLMVAGVAAGISAVFRTPLGAALLAIEILYRDDFESEALIPAVLASVVAYALSASLISTVPMFGLLPAFPFHWEHLPLYLIEALVVAFAAAVFVAALRGVQRAAARLPGPAWARPAFGGLALGCLALATMELVPGWLDVPASFVGLLGGGYGNAQLAITGDAGLGLGLTAAGILLVTATLRILATAFTVGTGGSAGDFAPSMAIGALFGGAFGHAAVAWLGMNDLAVGAFALVGMATFYGGIAKVPLAATVMVCEMAGSYQLLVPLMLAQGVAFVALRRVALYPAQLTTQRESPAHAAVWARQAIAQQPASSVTGALRTIVTLGPGDSADHVLRTMADSPDQPVFPVVDGAGILRGLVTGPGTREIAADDDPRWAVAADLMVPPIAVRTTTPLAEVAKALVAHDLRAIPIVDDGARVIGLLDEHDLSRAYLREPGAGD
ncbi:MAG: chloride channel protein [Kofleriaceae bacterium]